MRPLLAVLFLFSPPVLTAQEPELSSRALGLAGAYTAIARGFEAPSWNPAMLAGAGRPSFSIGLPSLAFEFGSNVFGLRDVRRYAGRTLSAADKADLLARLDTALAVRAIATASPFGLSVGRFALAFSAFGDMDARLGRDAVELALIGNAHRSGPGEFFTAAGSRSRGWAAMTMAASFAAPVRVSRGRLSVGATAKYTWGLALGGGEETSSRFQVDPTITARGSGHALFAHTGEGRGGPPGRGAGLDLGALLELPEGVTFGTTLVNAITTMRWDPARFRYERVDYLVAQDASGGLTDSLVQRTLTGSQIDADSAGRALRSSVLEHSSFSRVLRAGVTRRTGRLMLVAEGSIRLREGLDRQPRQALAFAAEYTLLRFLALRAGIGNDFGDGVDLSGGVGLAVGVLHLDVGVANIRGTEHPGVRMGVGLSLLPRR